MKKKTDGVTRLLDIGSGLVSVCAGLLATVLILYSGYVLYDNLAIEVSAFSSNSDLLKYKPSVMAEAPAGPSLADINPDYRGWITVDDNPIDYPVVQGGDDLYYAYHDANRESSLTGAIYLAAANSPDFADSYNLLYGHHMNSGAMFGSLDKFRNESYFNSHQKATVTTESGKVYDVTFFAVVNTDAYEKKIYTVGNRAAEVKAFLTGSRADDAGLGTEVLIYRQSVASGANKILALSTCASADTLGRLVVFGRMTEKEKPTPTTTTHGGGSSPTPTPTAAPEQDEVRLTVRYLDETGRSVFPDQVFIHTPGDRYYVVSPQMPGYEMSTEVLRGTIDNDMTIVVHYTPKTYHLTVKYVFPDGTEATTAYRTEVRTGERYRVGIPDIEGYRTLRGTITGVNPGRDESYTVIYIPEGQGGFTGIDDYDTPLNPGYNDLQVGICIE